jgi:hypothetical protein
MGVPFYLFKPSDRASGAIGHPSKHVFVAWSMIRKVDAGFPSRQTRSVCAEIMLE